MVGHFAPPTEPWLAGHRGVDLAALAGTQVYTAGTGTVAFAGPVGGRDVVAVSHPGGLRTTYLPVVPAVKAGQAVTPGDLIGTIGATGYHCTTPCLHWGLRHGPTYLDPLLLVGRPHLRLLPHWPTRTSPPA